ncbi:MAG: class I SAM-dependent methyltransferase [bacterium]
MCRKKTHFFTDFKYSYISEKGKHIPNWREQLVCKGCKLNNRMRGSFQIFEQECKPKLDDKIYITEQKTPIFKYLKNKYKNIIGSEYMGDNIPNENTKGLEIKNENLENLSFSNNQFDYILCFDVFEHIPNYKKAFQECFRCLKPNGRLLFSVPFNLQSQRNIVRAKIKSNGEVEYFFPPEYHGDPMKPDGCLCYYHFGWESLNELRKIGFRDVSSFFYWSKELGYLGKDQFIFIAKK